MSKKNMTLVSFMLFSLFFGAGNLIFPPFLGQNAGTAAPAAMAGFLITAVVLPVLGVVVVARFDGLDRLSRRVGRRFSLAFTVLIYLSIGPGLGIPRAASVPFEMAVAPYLPQGANATGWMAAYSLVFFAVALWLCLTPGKLVRRIGNYLTPTLLVLLVFLFVSFLLRGERSVAAPREGYAAAPLLTGFVEGYQTMDTIAALNFGLVIATTLGSFGLTEKRDVLRRTVQAGLAAGSILALVYAMLGYMGMCSSGVYRRGAAGGHLHPGLPDHLRGADQFHQPVFHHPFSPHPLPGLGDRHHRLLLPGVQPGAECDPRRVHPHPQRHLSHGHRADPAGPDPPAVGKQPLCLPPGRGRGGGGERAPCAAYPGRAHGVPAPPVPKRFHLAPPLRRRPGHQRRTQPRLPPHPPSPAIHFGGITLFG